MGSSETMIRPPCTMPLHPTSIALAALFVLASASEVTAQSRHRAAQHGGAPPAQFQQRNPTTSPTVKPFTAEEKGWFDRASKVY